MKRTDPIDYIDRIKLTNIPRPQQRLIMDAIEEYLNDENLSEAFLSLSGLPGSGKSHIAQNVYKEIRNNQDYRKLFSAYVDVSDCADEVDVYHRIAVAREQFLSNTTGSGKQLESLKQFFTIYEWIYGATKKGTVENTNTDGVGGFVNKALTTLHNELDASEVSMDDSNEVWGLVFDSLDVIMKAIPYVSLVKSSVEIIAKTHEEQYAARLLREAVDAIREKSKREELFRTLLVRSMKGINRRPRKCENRAVIVLDNFQLEQSNDLGRDQSWLSREGRLMNSVNAFWLIVSRMETTELFAPVIKNQQGVFEGIYINGFTKEQAWEYMENICPKPEGENALSDEEYQGVIARMLDVCKTEDVYLPYILKLVAKHYDDLVSDPLHRNLKPEDFAKFTGELSKDELFDYYFYKDMSDLMINAFQILSCNAVWDDFWIGLVRERFDNHLLNARNLLEHSAPMEEPEDGNDQKFKLHEAIKDGLFRSKQNYIKRDVLKYFYDVFRMTYTSEMSEEQKQIWYDENRMQTITELVYAYLDETLITLDSVETMFDKIYDDNKNRGIVGESFIRFYGRYLDKLKDEGEVPFLNHRLMNTSELEKEKEEIKSLVSQWDYSTKRYQAVSKYLKCCYKYADLFTNYNQPDEAINLEKMYLYFCNEMLRRMENCEVERKDQMNCVFWEIKALNAVAYDSSQEHFYEDAYYFGSEGLKETKKFGRTLLDSTELMNLLSSEEKKLCILLLDPDDQDEFDITEGIEMNGELFVRMISFYSRLMDKDFIDNPEGKLLCTLMVELHQNLRGNFPWYQLQTEKYDVDRKDDVWKFGARTYWMRKAILRATEVVNMKEGESIEKYSDRLDVIRGKMLKAYHNVCVYLYKIGYVDRACALENEVIRQSERMRKRVPLNQKRIERFENLQRRVNEYKSKTSNGSAVDSGDITALLWERESISHGEEQSFFEISDEISEQFQYLSDCYLHMKWYAIAKRQLETILLRRSICYGLSDSKSLDTMLRLYIAAFAQDDKELMAVLDVVIGGQENTLLNLQTKAKGIVEKEEKLRRVRELATETEGREELVKKMLAEADKKRKDNQEHII